MELALLGLLISILSFIGAVIIAFVSHRYLRKQHRINGLQDAFKILNNSEHRNFRKKVYELHHEFQETGKLDIFYDIPEVENVRADFDLIGVFVKNKNLHAFCLICSPSNPTENPQTIHVQNVNSSMYKSNEIQFTAACCNAR